MPFTPEIDAHITAQLRARGVRDACPYCGGSAHTYVTIAQRLCMQCGAVVEFRGVSGIASRTIYQPSDPTSDLFHMSQVLYLEGTEPVIPDGWFLWDAFVMLSGTNAPAG